ncbi:SPOR domain-containing protein [Sphingosinicella soli]|uniref:Flp pilus assembly protein TadD n=1 Tax=Sphingosinicella soli TaxID=333708 RepID=A0A7W7B2E3_9SPHN|nr:SPOR domain-containing protein [Sphingosinicella soli]MBB4631833.1 Flp pilus assembly protein TadD [Sphingosinicella soli]
MIRAATAFLLIAATADPSLAQARKEKEDTAVAALSNPARLVTIGDHARASSDFMLALSFYERALGIDPGFVAALRASTEVSLAMRMPQALSYAERWVRATPKDGLAHLAVGAALVQQNRPTEAQKSFALAEAAGGPLAAIAMQRGLAFDLLGQSKNAQIAYADAMQRVPGDRSIIEHLALSLAIGGDNEAAMQLLQPEADLASGQASFERTLVLVHALGGRLDLARRIATANLSPQAASAAGDVLERITSLPTPAAKAAAVHLGILPDTARPPQVQAQAQVQAEVKAPEVVQASPPEPIVEQARVIESPPPRAEPAPAKPAAAKPAAGKPAPKAEPLPAGLPKLSPAQLRAAYIWLQLSSSPERGLVAGDLARFKRKAGAIGNYNAYVQSAAGTHRLLIGPFRSADDAQKVSRRLKAAGVDSYINRAPAGSSIAPL